MGVHLLQSQSQDPSFSIGTLSPGEEKSIPAGKSGKARAPKQTLLVLEAGTSMLPKDL